MSLKIGIIVLNWQNWPQTLHCLDSLKQLQPLGQTMIIVCDNASSNDSFERILAWGRHHYAECDLWFKPPTIEEVPERFYPWVLIQTGANLGFAGGNNVGIRYALAHHCDYVWVLNNDTQVDPQALVQLHRCMHQHPQLALVGSTLIDAQKRDTVQCAGGCRYFPWLTIFKPVLGGYSLQTVLHYQQPLKLDYVAGAAMFFRATVLRQVGLLNEEYFLFYEELDYTQRLKRQGYSIGWCQHSLVYHQGSASVGTVEAGNRDQLRRANYYENLSTLKYTARFYPARLIGIMAVRFVLKSLVLILRRDFYLLAPLLSAYRDFIRFNSKANRSEPL